MSGNDGADWALIGGFAVLVCVAVLGGVALSNAGPASAAVGADDTDRNTTDGSEAVAEDCPSADALRKEVYDGLEDRSVEEVRSVIPDDAVRCLPPDVQNALELDNETDGNGTDDNSTDSDECPSDGTMRAAVEMALANSTVATVREEVPDDERDCLPADVKDRLQIDDGTNASTAAGTATETEAESASGTETEGTDCPSPETLRKEVNKTLERMPAAQFRTMVPDDYVACFPPDLKQRLGLTGSTGTASADGDTPSAGQGSTGSSAPAGAADRDSFDTGGDGSTDSVSNASDGLPDSDGDGVPDRYDYAPRDPDVQSKSDVQGADDPGNDGEGGDDGIPVAGGSALLLVLAVGTGATVYRRYGGTGADDELPQPTDPEPAIASESREERHDVFGESAFDPGDTQAEFTFDDHGDDDGFVFDNDPADEDVITLDSDDSVTDEEADAGFVFEGEPSEDRETRLEGESRNANGHRP